MNDNSFNIRVPKKWARVGMIVLVTALIVAPLTAIASHTFTDVPDSNTFHEDIAWLEASGVTKGCNPPANTEFCPKDNVTREQMSAFMRRLAENQVVDADKVDGKDASELVEKGEVDSVSAEMLTDEPGVAMASTDGQILIDGTLSSVLSVTVDAPAAGYVVATADMQLNVLHTNGTTSTIEVGLSESAGSYTQNHQDNAVGVPSGAPSGYYFQSPGLTTVIPVTAGSTTIHLVADVLSGAAGSGINDATLQAFYVPTAYGAVSTASQSGGGEDPAQ